MAVIYVLMYFKCKICFILYTGETKINDTYLLTYKNIVSERLFLVINLKRLLNVIKEWDRPWVSYDTACLVNPITVYSYSFLFNFNDVPGVKL